MIKYVLFIGFLAQSFVYASSQSAIPHEHFSQSPNTPLISVSTSTTNNADFLDSKDDRAFSNSLVLRNIFAQNMALEAPPIKRSSEPSFGDALEALHYAFELMRVEESSRLRAADTATDTTEFRTKQLAEFEAYLKKQEQNDAFPKPVSFETLEAASSNNEYIAKKNILHFLSHHNYQNLDISASQCAALAALNAWLRRPNSQAVSPTKVYDPEALSILCKEGLTQKKIRLYLKIYANFRPKPVRNEAKFSPGRIDRAAMRVIFKPSQMNALRAPYISSPCKEAFKDPTKIFTHAEYKQYQEMMRAQKALTNFCALPPQSDPNALFLLEESVLSPFRAWIAEQKKQKKSHLMHPSMINMMLYECFKEPLEKGFYDIVKHPNGYIWVYPTVLYGAWKNRQGDTNVELMTRGQNPVDINTVTMHAHHVSTDILTHPSKHEKYRSSIAADPEAYAHASPSVLFQDLCVIFLMSNQSHTFDIHYYTGKHAIRPNRTLFGYVREEMNSVIGKRLWPDGCN